jgi:4-hydroxythreonine-4-phosphate dehydrogenase
MAGASRGICESDLEMSAPLLLTMGDACGIGPEIVARAFVRGTAGGCVAVGDPGVMRRALQQVDASWPLAVLDGPTEIGRCPPRCLPLWVPDGLPPGLAELPPGRVDARAGAAAAACIEAAVRAVQRGDAAAIVTAPIHKEAFAAAGVPYPGHTEMLAALAGGPPVRMMLANDELRVVLATIHVSLRRALDLLDHDTVLDTIRIAARAAQAWSAGPPRVAVAGLNPHAGEGGLFGDEETHFIAPAVQSARAEGIDASGPHAPDTVFMRARQGAFDVVVSMVHDHGLIAVKYLGVEHGVNVTLGLPFVRTSPDHGTAFDIAGQGKADPRSLEAAIVMARRMAGAADVTGEKPAPS